jgi:hypothetical protein
MRPGPGSPAPGTSISSVLRTFICLVLLLHFVHGFRLGVQGGVQLGYPRSMLCTDLRQRACT